MIQRDSSALSSQLHYPSHSIRRFLTALMHVHLLRAIAAGTGFRHHIKDDPQKPKIVCARLFNFTTNHHLVHLQLEWCDYASWMGDTIKRFETEVCVLIVFDAYNQRVLIRIAMSASGRIVWFAKSWLFDGGGDEFKKTKSENLWWLTNTHCKGTLGICISIQLYFMLPAKGELWLRFGLKMMNM